MLPLGFASGLPLALTGGTLQAWLTLEQVDLETIGWFTLVGLPYTVKFLWAPIMDRFVPPWLGRRRGWMLVTQLALMVGVVAMAATGPVRWPVLFACLALAVAFASASQDIIFDAYRTDVLEPGERGGGAAVWVNGYRLALLVSGTGALLLSETVGWPLTYGMMAALMIAGVATIWLCPEPQAPPTVPRSLSEAAWGPIREFMARPSAVWLSVLVGLYKVGDAFASTLMTTFLIRGVGFSAGEVGFMKGLGLGATLVGALAGASLMLRWGLFRSLLLFGALQALSNLSFAALAWVGHSYALLVCATVIENLSGGMGTAAFVALIMSLCDHRFTATQFALLSSLEALGRVFLGRPSADLVATFGWGPFFVLTTAAALPGLWVLWRLRELVNRLASV
jgi:PAT family beta-lactamase induction signal transducer AmpG